MENFDFTSKKDLLNWVNNFLDCAIQKYQHIKTITDNDKNNFHIILGKLPNKIQKLNLDNEDIALSGIINEFLDSVKIETESGKERNPEYIRLGFVDLLNKIKSYCDELQKESKNPKEQITTTPTNLKTDAREKVYNIEELFIKKLERGFSNPDHVLSWVREFLNYYIAKYTRVEKPEASDIKGFQYIVKALSKINKRPPTRFDEINQRFTNALSNGEKDDAFNALLSKLSYILEFKSSSSIDITTEFTDLKQDISLVDNIKNKTAS